ncbi:MAG: hypothetical protein ACR2GY_10610 [Phycisphaerales bacterium]
MPGEHRFQFIRELTQGPVFATWLVQAEGDSQPRFIARLLRDHPAMGEAENAHLRADFLRAGVTRRLLTQAGCNAWLPLTEIVRARDEHGRLVALVSPKRDRSLASLVTTHVRPDARGLHRLMHNIARGLEQLDELDHRQHGNLSPGNVLLDGNLNDENVLIELTDCLAGDSADRLDRRVDLEAVGELLFETVLHRKYPGPLVLPLEADACWRRIGRNGEAWCELCNDLLASDRPDSVQNLAQLRSRIDALFIKPRSRKPFYIGGSLAGAAAAALLIIALIPEPPPECDPDEAAWSRWARSMGNDPPQWFRTLVVLAENPQDQSTLTLATAIENLGRVMEIIRDARGDIEFDPIALLPDDLNGRSNVYFDAQPFAQYLSLNDWCKVKDAVEYLDSAQAGMDTWLLEQSLRSEELRSRGYHTLADFIRAQLVGIDSRLAEGVEILTPPPGPGDQSNGVNGTQAIEPSVDPALLHRSYNIDAAVQLCGLLNDGAIDDIERSSGTIASAQRQLQAVPDDAFLARIAPAVQSLRTQPISDVETLKRLRAQSNALAAALTELTAFLERSGDDIAFARLAGESELYQNNTAALEAEEIAAWIEAAETYTPVTVDPRNAVDFDALLTGLREYNAQLAQLAPAEAEQQTIRIAELEERVVLLRNQSQPLRVDEAAITATVETLNADLRSLSAEIVAMTGSPEEWLTETTTRLANPPFANAAVRAAYTAQLQRIAGQIDTMTPDALSGDSNFSTYVTLRSQEQRIFRWLSTIDAPGPHQLIIDAQQPEIASSTIDIAQAENWLTQRRSTAMNALIDSIDFDTLDHLADDAERQRDINARTDQHPAWQSFLQDVSESRTALTDFAVAEGALENAVLPGDDDETVATLREAPADLYARLRQTDTTWSASPDDAQLAQAVAAIASRLTALQTVMNAPAADVDRWATQPPGSGVWQHPESARASWERAIEVASTGTRAAFDRDRALIERATDRLSTLEDAARRAAVAASIRNESSARWIDHARAATDTALLEAVLADGAAFNVSFDAGTEALTAAPDVEFNLRRFQTQTAAASAADATSLERILRDAIAQLEASSLANRLEPADRAAFQGYVRDLRLLFDEDQKKQFDPAELRTGPAIAGWRYIGDGDFSVVPPAQLIYQSPDGNHTLVFRRIGDPATEGPFAYLCVDETSIGLYRSLITNADRWDELGPEGDRFLSLPDRFLGPRPWAWQDGRIQPALTWIENEPVAGDGRHDVDYSPTPLTAPDDRTPMTYVTPAAALLAAGVVGCRLPTIDEWNAARLSAEPNQENNLRDTAWNTLFQHVLTERNRLQQQGDALIVEDYIWPDTDVFLPAAIAGDSNQRDAVTAANATPAVNTSDGNVWFKPVDPGAADAQGFRNIIGNVAEFVLADARGIDAVDRGTITLRSLGDLLGNDLASLQIIGGSALSPGSVPLDQPQTLRTLGRRYAERGAFADVGFRLAFTLDGDYAPPLRTRYARVLEAHPYLLSQQ